MKNSNFTQGNTAPQDFQLFTVDSNGNQTPFDATAGGGTVAVFTIALLVTSKVDASVVNTSGNVDWLTPAQGLVRYIPDSGDLLAAKSPYDVRWNVTDSASRVVSFPDGIADRWVVRL